MRKVLVKVKDGGCFFDMNCNGQTAMGDRPYILEVSSFVNLGAAQGRIEILGEVKADCTDKNFYKFYANEKDKKAAVAKFLKAKGLVKENKEPAKEEPKKEETEPAKNPAEGGNKEPAKEENK